jgi:hypothetical protein
MIPILALSLLLPLTPAAGAAPDPWSQVRLTIARDPYTSSDQVTLCRVRAVNFGPRSWQGRDLAFEARALGGGSVVKQRGRFGLELAPYGSLETLVALPGRHDRFEVVPLPATRSSGDPEKMPRKRGKRRPRP